MAKDTIINGKRCRWYSNGKLWVSDDGTLAVAPGKKNRWGVSSKKSLSTKLAPDGRKYVTHPYGYDIYIDTAVITCFCPPAPKDGKTYVIHHKDGSLGNCHYKNLEWVLYHYHHATTDTVKLKINGKTLEVHKDGTIRMSGKEQTVYDSFYDSDMDLEVCSWAPYVYVPKKGSIHDDRAFLDDLMDDAGFVDGDDADKNDPKILHKDNDYMNCSSDNLEWVEGSDERYKTFLGQRNKDCYEKEVKKNPGKKVPEYK